MDSSPLRSPQAAQRRSTEVAEQASIEHFIEKTFRSVFTLNNLDPNAMDAQANDLMNAFDFMQEPNRPLVLAERSCP